MAPTKTPQTSGDARPLDPTWTPPPTRQLAAILWDLLGGRAPASDLALLDAITEARPEGLPWSGPARRNWSLVRVLQLGAATTSDGQCSAIGLARWAQHGFRMVTMPATYTAALLATTIQDSAEAEGSILSTLEPPFPAFVIDVPEELLPVDNPAGPDFVTRVLVFRHQHRAHPDGAWAYVAWTKGTLTLWRFGVSASDLLPAELETSGIAAAMASFPVEVTELDQRTTVLLGRLIVNTCLAMTDPANVRVKGAVCHVGRRLELDLRDEVRAYARGEVRRAPAAGGWVSSHWKMQPYGPGKMLRKCIFVEPYWRGEDAVGTKRKP